LKEQVPSEKERHGLEKKSMRYYDEKSGLWYMIYWDEAMECYVSQLETGQRVRMFVEE